MSDGGVETTYLPRQHCQIPVIREVLPKLRELRSKLKYLLQAQGIILRRVQVLHIRCLHSLLLRRQQALHEVDVDRLEGWEVETCIDCQQVVDLFNHGKMSLSQVILTFLASILGGQSLGSDLAELVVVLLNLHE